MSMADTIRRMSTSADDGGYTLIRKTRGYTDSDGVWHPGVSLAPVPFDGIIQPDSNRITIGSKLIIEPHGNSTASLIAIATLTPLYTVKNNNTYDADVVVYRGCSYTVIKVDGPIHIRHQTHYEAYAQAQGAP